MNAFSGVDQRVKVHVAYARVFDDALNEIDLITYCDPDDPDGVMRALEDLESEGLIERRGGYCFLPGYAVDGQSAAVAARQRRAEELLAENGIVLRLLHRLPWVRLLAISGSLARDNPRTVPGKPVDLDLFIIAAPASVHIIRLVGRVATNLRTLLARMTLSPAPARVCLNYVTESSCLEITNKSLFTASDALHVRVLKDRDEHGRFLSANAWIERYYPLDRRTTIGVDEVEAPSAPRAALNLLCFFAMGVAQWVKGRIIGRTLLYSLRPRPDRSHSIRRVAQKGGGYQPQVAARFREIYRRHFGVDEELEQFLFPDTTTSGVYVERVHVRPIVPTLAFDE